MENNKIFTNPLSILRGCALLLIYSLVSFFYFHYRSHTSDGHAIEFFDVDFATYVFYFIASVIISIWMGLSSSFNKQVFKVAGILIVVDIVACFIPAYFVPWGLAFFPTLVCILILFIFALIVFNITKPLTDKLTVSTVVAALLFFILCPVIYMNYHDLSVKGKIIYKNNAMFDSLDECDAYIYLVRRNDCKKDWTNTHDKWVLQEMTNNVNLDPSLEAVPGSANYQYFPSENIVDVKIGTGELARYNEKAVINVLGVDIKGKTYDSSTMPNNPTLTNMFKNFKINLNTNIESYDSYALGVIGMKVGGVRKITFKTSEGYWFTGVEPMILVDDGESVTYKVELVSVSK